MYVTIGRLEIFITRFPDFGRLKAHCDCIIFELGYIGFTWLSDDCKNKEVEDDSSSDS